MKKLFIAWLPLLLIACSSQEDPAQSAVPDDAIREITQISGNLYRARNNNHYTVFLVTPEGTILGDPLNTDFSEWLKAELNDRFGSTVRYVIYSHHHFDHASGGAVFEDTAQFVGHENMVLALQAELPGNQIANDTDGDGKIQKEEALGGLAKQFDLIDTDSDGDVTGSEFNADIRALDISYSDRLTVTLGGQEVSLIHPPQNHSGDMTVLEFPSERVAFGVDFINLKQLGGRLVGATIDEWGAALTFVADLDVDTVIPGHGKVGTTADVAAFWQFIQDLDAAVAAAIVEGKTLAQMQESIDLPQYSEWVNYETGLAIYIEGAYDLRMAEAQ
jgi:glyoxylase-like metal-dependent hydrolase (beta-lactamase superfamily II)